MSRTTVIIIVMGRVMGWLVVELDIGIGG